jgi:hypothetical protein
VSFSGAATDPDQLHDLLVLLALVMVVGVIRLWIKCSGDYFSRGRAPLAPGEYRTPVTTPLPATTQEIPVHPRHQLKPRRVAPAIYISISAPPPRRRPQNAGRHAR